MSGEQNWRIGTDAEDYFGHQQKQLAVADRRPVPRKASDLGLGPGMAAQAVSISDFNNLLATYNGFYSAGIGTPNAPNEDEAFVGTVVMDAEKGGVQKFVGLESEQEFKRVFVRNPSDASAIFWGAWTLGGGGGMGPGFIGVYAGPLPPEGWLPCDGASYNVTVYPELFEAIGYTWGGSGDTFRVPDARDRALYGAGSSWALGSSDGMAYGSRPRNLPHIHLGIAGTEGSNHEHSGWASDATVSVNVSWNTETAPSAAAGSGSVAAHAFHNHASSSSPHGHSVSIGSSGSHTHQIVTTEFHSAPNLPGVGVNVMIKAN